MIARWIGAIGMAHLHLGRLLPAHNHMQVREHSDKTPQALKAQALRSFGPVSTSKLTFSTRRRQSRSHAEHHTSPNARQGRQEHAPEVWHRRAIQPFRRSIQRFRRIPHYSVKCCPESIPVALFGTTPQQRFSSESAMMPLARVVILSWSDLPQIRRRCSLSTPALVGYHQEALVYLRFPAVPSQALPLDRIACLAKECCLSRGPARDPEDILFAARLYGSIADISIKVE